MRRRAVCWLLVGLGWAPWSAAAYPNATTPNLLRAGAPRPLFDDRRPDGCPPCPSCFNCNAASDVCHQFAECNKFNGKCVCPSGFGGDDCTVPLCGALPDGNDQREPRPDDVETCTCSNGWGGINCNVCATDDACRAFYPPDDLQAQEGAVCYQEPLVVKENYQMCDVTNPQIIKQLKDRAPQVTFSCNADDKECTFQFWVAQHESFYCGLDTCSWSVEHSPDKNVTQYNCEHIKCACIPGQFLCGENGSIDLTEFLSQQIKGPATFVTTSTEGSSSNDGSRFEEPAMNTLISSIFADSAITMKCRAGECLYKTEVPGYVKPIPKINTPLIAGIIAGVALLLVVVVLVLWYLARRRFDRGAIYLDGSDDEHSRLMSDHKPASLQFQNLSYQLNDKQILQGIRGIAQSGQVMAIMGASGAGKTTFLDILARKNKRGTTTGDFFVNGEKVSDADFKSVVGFVDQEDTMLPTLTVHETILNSALLRLPRDMGVATKEAKVHEVERQLGIYHIKDQLIGSEEGRGRGISGGEKRRVGIACELVTSPSILFLDEPTSGLDAFNAFNVIECLVTLAQSYNRTVIFTIHQPRSNIVSLFDQLVLLAKGRTVYSGPMAQCQQYFDSIGYSCPPGFNIADYLVDLTMHAGRVEIPADAFDGAADGAADGGRTTTSSVRAIKSIRSVSNVSVDNSAIGSYTDSTRRADLAPPSIKQQQERRLFTRKPSAPAAGATATDGAASPETPRTDDEAPDLGGPAESTQQWLKLARAPGAVPPQILDDPHQLPPPASGLGPDLEGLVQNYASSSIAAAVRDEIHAAVHAATTANGAPLRTPGSAAGGAGGGGGGAPSIARLGALRSYRRIGLVRQFRILSRRTWTNLYRNPQLLLAHYAIAVLVAVLCGALYYGLTTDIKGWQDRLGLLFFLLALFGFSALTGLSAFAAERLLFVRERALGYYHPVTYFAAKVVCDVVPLRLLPPLVLAAVVYPMTGLVARWAEFCVFALVLVLFNLAAASVCLLIGILCRDAAVASLVGSLVMLFSLLFAGFLLNRDAMPTIGVWLQKLSIYHYGLEALLANEMRTLSLYEHKFGLDIEVPGASILSAFGFDPVAVWPDVVSLAIFAAVLLVVAYVAMHVLLVERR